VVRVFASVVPKTAANFGTLCTGQPIPPVNRASANITTFHNTPIHRIVPHQLIQGGDTTVGNGTGGRSAYNVPLANDMWGHFDDETPFLAHDRAGLLSMANTGPHTNSSQFFITARAMPHLNGKHVVFGEVVEEEDGGDDSGTNGQNGLSVIREMVQLPIDNPQTQRPLQDITITDCGRW
jgi:cyclophilin family peptidyl-prolyl cis-trans isomerase